MRGHWWLGLGAALAGCGSVPANNSDAGSQPGPVTVVAYSMARDGQPAIGARVAFHGPDGALVASSETDGTGVATADVLPGSSATIAWILPTGGRLLTFNDIRPGDTLIGGTPRDIAASSTGSTMVTITRFDPGYAHKVYTRCGSLDVPSSGAATVPIGLFDNCQAVDNDFDYLSIASNAPNPPQFVKLDDQDVASAVTLPDTWAAITPMTADFSNIPTQVTGLAMGRYLRSGGRYIYDSSVPRAAPTGSTLMLSDANAANAGDDMWILTQVDQGNVYQVQNIHRVQAVGSSYSLDVGSALLPWLSAPSIDVGTGVVTWTQEGGGAPYDIFVADVAYARTGTTSSTYRWRVLGETATGDLTLPTLPPEIVDLAPRAGDLAQVERLRLLEIENQGFRELLSDLDRNTEAILYPFESPVAAGRESILNCFDGC